MVRYTDCKWSEYIETSYDKNDTSRSSRLVFWESERSPPVPPAPMEMDVLPFVVALVPHPALFRLVRVRLSVPWTNHSKLFITWLSKKKLTCPCTASAGRRRCKRRPRPTGARGDLKLSCWPLCSFSLTLMTGEKRSETSGKNGGKLTVIEVKLVKVHALDQVAHRFRLERG